jgi:hypothetical protein
VVTVGDTVMEVEVAVSCVQPEPPQIPPAVVLEYHLIVPLGPIGRLGSSGPVIIGNVTVNV